VAYRNKSSRRRCSATSLVDSAKIVPSAPTREQRCWIFSLTAAVSCGGVRQDSFWNQGSQTNVVILVDGGDDAQDGFERGECFRRSHCDVEGNAENSKSGVLQISFHNWYVSTESSRHSDVCTYPPTLRMARLFPHRRQHCPLPVRRTIDICVNVCSNSGGRRRSLGGLFPGSAPLT
jgi:hypothetical protein